MRSNIGKGLSLSDLITKLEVYESLHHVLSQPLKWGLILGLITNVITVVFFYYCLPFFIKNIDSITLVSFIVRSNIFFKMVCDILRKFTIIALISNLGSFILKFVIMVISLGFRKKVPELVHWTSTGIVIVDTVLFCFIALTIFLFIISYLLPIWVLLMIVLAIVYMYASTDDRFSYL